MAATPYQVAHTQSSLMDSLLGGDQGTSMARLETKTQKGRLSEQFEQEFTDKQKEMEKELNKKRKKKWFEKFAPILSLFAGPIGAGVVGGLTSMYGLSKDESHARKQIQRAKVVSKMDPRWKKNFLSKPMREQEESKRTTFDKMMDSINVSGMDILTTGLTSGLQSYGMGKIAQGIGSAWKGAGTVAAPQMNITDIVKGTHGAGGLNVGKMVESSYGKGLAASGLSSADYAQGLTPEGLKIGSGKLKEFTKLLKESMSKEGGVSNLRELFEDNEELLQNLLYSLQWGQQLGDER